MDVIALHAAGFTNALATLGTAITPEHARLMKRYTKRVLISYDMDEAGRAAADKAMRLLEEVGLEVRILKMEGAKDPDEFIQKFGKDRFASVLSGSSTKFDYNMNRILSKYVLTDPQDKIDATKELCKLISEVASAAERDVYIHAAAAKLGIDATILRQDIDRMAARLQREGKKKDLLTVRQTTLGFTDRVNPDFVKMPGVATCEESVLELMLVRPEYCPMVAEGNIQLTQEHFLTEFNRRVFLAIMSNEEHMVDQELFTPDEFSRIVKMKVRRMELTDNSLPIFQECVRNLIEMANKQKQRTATTDLDALRALLEQKQNDSNT
jgi:DNA primase